jgi:sec-independent protein translocase protein TatC
VNDEKRSDLVSHLSELRARLLRAIGYAVAGMIVIWVFFDPVYRFMVRPIEKPLETIGGQLTVRGLLEGLLVKFEIALVGGIILASPFIFYEVYAFIAPGLTRRERRAVRPLIPVAGMLFLAGAGAGYLVTGPTVKTLLRYIPPETKAWLTLNETVLLLLKFYLAFGLGFQLPIVIVVLAKLGIVDSRMLISRWREAVIGVFVLAALITPTWDPITLTVAALPMVVLYIGTIGAVKLIERGERKAAARRDTLAG